MCEIVKHYEKGVSLVTRQFMCCVPVSKVQWEVVPANLTEELQQDILQQTVLHPTCIRHPVNMSYQRSFCKKIMRDVENSGGPICEKFYEEYVKLLKDDSLSFSFKSYYVPSIQNFIPVLESKKMLSCGTTGLNTWQGALLLSEWCLDNPGSLADKHILELGSGSGLVGVIACKACRPRSFVFTDYHDDVLSLLTSNVKSHFENICDKSCICDAAEGRNTPLPDTTNGLGLQDLNTTHLLYKSFYKETNVRAAVRCLDWCSTKDLKNIVLDFPQVDIIFAADVVFDPALIPHLVKTLSCLMKTYSSCVTYFSVTVRNPDTYKLFLDTLKTRALTIEEIKPLPPRVFFFDRSADMRLVKIGSCSP